MIWHHLDFNQRVSVLGLLLDDEFLQPVGNATGEDLASVLRAPDDVVLTTVDNAMIAMVLLGRLLEFHMPPLVSMWQYIYHTSRGIANLFYQSKAAKATGKPLYPSPKGTGLYGIVS